MEPSKLKDPLELIEQALKPKDISDCITLLGTEFLLLPAVHFIAAITKNGKTNFAANLVCDVLSLYSDKKVFVALNEETNVDFVVRCGCILSGLNFYAWKSGKFTPAQTQVLRAALERIVPRISMLDEEKVNLGCLEDVTRVIRGAAKSDKLKLVVFDYLQNVQQSTEFPAKSQYELSKILGVRLKDIGKTTKCPIVVFGQLKDDTDNTEAGFKSRVEGDSWFVNNVASGIELKAHKLQKLSCLTVHVDRFQGKTHEKYWLEHSHTGKLTITNRSVGQDSDGQDEEKLEI